MNCSCGQYLLGFTVNLETFKNYFGQFVWIEKKKSLKIQLKIVEQNPTVPINNHNRLWDPFLMLAEVGRRPKLWFNAGIEIKYCEWEKCLTKKTEAA